MLETIQSQLPIILFDKYLIRHIVSDDKNDIFDIYSNEKISKYIARKVHTTIEDSEEFIEVLKGRMKDDNNLYLGICETKSKKLIGIIRFLIKEDQKIITIGYGLNEDYWGNGIVSKVMDELISYIKLDNKYTKLRATVKPKNINSQRCLEKLNFKKNGEFMKEEIINDKKVKTKRFLYFRQL